MPAPAGPASCQRGVTRRVSTDGAERGGTNNAGRNGWARPASASSLSGEAGWSRPGSVVLRRGNSLAAAMVASDRTSADVLDPRLGASNFRANGRQRRRRGDRECRTWATAWTCRSPGKLLYNASGGTSLNTNRFRGGSEALSFQEFDQRDQDVARQQNRLAERQIAAMSEQLEERDRQLELYGQMIQNFQQPRDAQDEALVRAQLTVREQAAQISQLSWEKRAAELAAQLSEQKALELGAKLRASLLVLEQLRASLEGSVSEARGLKASLLPSPPPAVAEAAGQQHD